MAQVAHHHSSAAPGIDGRPGRSERTITVLVGVLVTYMAATSVWEAANRPFWYDEVFTVALTRLPSFQDVLAALANAADTSAPGFYVLQRAVVDLVADEHVAFRISSVVSGSLVSLCLYLMARREVGAMAAASGALVPVFSHLYHGYSVEARPYAPMLGLLAVAALAWQRADSRWWWVVMAGALAAASSIHYYAVFNLVPFALAELTVVARARRVRRGVWAALLLGAVPLVVNWSTLSAIRDYYGAHYWSKAGIGPVLVTYDRLMSVGVPGLGFGVTAVVGVTLVVLVVRVMAMRNVANQRRTPPAETLVLILGFLALPLIVGAAAMLMDGGYTERYALGLIVGVALAVAYSVGSLGSTVSRWTLICLLGGFAAHELVFWGSGGTVNSLPRQAVERHRRILDRAAELGLPVVMSNGIDFVPLRYYLGSDSPVELVSLIDPEGARLYMGSDSIDLDLRVLNNYLDLEVRDFAAFRSENRRFALVSTPGFGDWWPTRLLAEGYRLEVFLMAGSDVIYTVEQPDGAVLQ